MQTNHFLDLLFPGDSLSTDHECWNVLESRDFKVLINFMILNKLSTIINAPHEMDDLVELKTYAKILHQPSVLKEYFQQKEIEPEPSSDLELF